ncbi:Uncharacterized protein conserved in bacteria [Helicobacter fennelliae]|uniref:Uncharacterized protein conserved in bacteria n=1 Tax=Helicobacter fennelliae TaxID=215 RepID=A0A2X3BCN1_9HELI|nr:DUF2059 domain-containing protein [Helicobacter fennelliae]SQB98373.1 Uncharacterized protein conserved in bacteria [Helicobacter fennelliae]
MKIAKIMGALCFCAVIGIADDASYKKSFDRFLEVSQANAVLKELTDGKMVDKMLQSLYTETNTQINESQKTEIARIMKNTMKDIFDEAVPAILEMYKKYFTESDLKEMTKFYETAAGQKMAKSLISIQEDTQQIMLKVMTTHFPAMQQKVQEVLESGNGKKASSTNTK